ncbi:hypothetical protein NFX46_26740 [Streptomyces phaeoluteigriseus]|uniref:Uncharacterized protein n=1 Tax=Streptomyces phaeoluteigriseus TaxID=114686 RepID=A0ABY4ZFD9_9ACTN|nr:hypothetical protein [Streptomyces phaeoluteigriseus]USQ86997.1 hypothetical protein NFX46_26740 [Streptomyces phaeoluteigriseus]
MKPCASITALAAQNGELEAAIRTAQKMLSCYGDSSGFGEFGYVEAHGALTESMRILLRALGAEDKGSATVRTPGGDQSEAAPRCPAAHPEDPTPCDGRTVVAILDTANASAEGCAHHGARLLASLDGARVYALPDAPATRVFKAADTIRPFPWLAGVPRTRDEQLSRAEVRARGERP